MVTAIQKKPKVDITAANRAVKFFSSLKLSTGKYAGKQVKLMDWQINDLIVPAFGTLKKDHLRQYRTIYLEIPRKNTKTETGAMFGNYLLFADNEMGAQIYSCAGDQQQAGLIFNAAAPMIEQSPSMNALAKINHSIKRIIVRKFNSFWQVLSAEAYTKHGLNPQGILFDELHVQPDRELWDVMRTSTGAREQPMTVVMTTAGYDRNTIGWEIHDYALKVKNGIIEDPTFLPIIYAAPEDADWTNENVWMSCNPAIKYGILSLDELRTECRQAQEMPAMEMTFRRLHLNQWVNSVERWLPMDKWDACKGTVDIEDLKGRDCYAGLDLSSTTDLTALAYVFPYEGGRYKTLMRFFIPEDTMREHERKDRVPYSEWVRRGYITATPGNVIDYKYIQSQLCEDRELFNIRELAYDRWGAAKLMTDLQEVDFVIDQKLAGEGRPLLVPFGQGYASMSGPTKELMKLVLSQKVEHGNNPVLRWCADNLVVTHDPADNLKPDKAKATQRIDGMVALIMAIGRAILHPLDDGKSVYETRGPLIYNL